MHSAAARLTGTRNQRGAAWLVHTSERLQAAQGLVQRRRDFDRLLGPDGRGYLDACRNRDEAARAEREAQLKRIADEQARVAEEQQRTALAQQRTRKFQRYTNLLMAGVAIILAGVATWIIAQRRAVALQTSRVLVGGGAGKRRGVQ